jgi:hypothetical protein
MIDCIAYANSCSGFIGAVAVLIRCISANNTGSNSDGFGGTTTGTGMGANQGGIILDHCIAYTNGRDGFRFNSDIITGGIFENCIAYGNVGKDINCLGAFTAGGFFPFSNFYATNTNYQTVFDPTSAGVLTADPTVAGASNNFALNTTPGGGGAACVGAGFPGVLSVGGTGYATPGPLTPASGVATIPLTLQISDYIAIADI